MQTYETNTYKDTQKKLRKKASGLQQQQQQQQQQVKKCDVNSLVTFRQLGIKLLFIHSALRAG